VAVLLKNKKANFDYEVLETFQAGLSLSGVMVKLVRNREVTLEGKYIIFQRGKLQIIGLGNSTFSENVALLLQKKEIREIKENLQIKGRSCVILNIKTVGRWLKAEIAVVVGRKKQNKKELLKSRDIDREVRRDFKALT
jgi:SsrA-binding protein